MAHALERGQDQIVGLYIDDHAELADLAHWLKGAGGTVGFAAFTQPARELEQSAKRGETETLGAMLTEVKDLADSIEIPTAQTVG